MLPLLSVEPAVFRFFLGRKVFQFIFGFPVRVEHGGLDLAVMESAFGLARFAGHALVRLANEFAQEHGDERREHNGVKGSRAAENERLLNPVCAVDKALRDIGQQHAHRAADERGPARTAEHAGDHARGEAIKIVHIKGHGVGFVGEPYANGPYGDRTEHSREDGPAFFAGCICLSKQP